jgi:endonuclease YncB( thermonuclease family)
VSLALAAQLLAALPAAAQGPGTIGGMIKVRGEVFRLWGIDVPDYGEVCDDGWPAGQEAVRTLMGLVQGRKVTCEPRGQDRFKRALGRCLADGVDLSAAMVTAGLAWALPSETPDYVPLERSAENERRGVHDHSCILPWKWREQRPQRSEAPGGRQRL